MTTLERLEAMMPGNIAAQIERRREKLLEVRLRANRPVQLIVPGDEWLSESITGIQTLRHVAMSLMDHSLYAREAELRQGYFTLPDGCRVGVCGRVVAEDGRIIGLSDVSALCVRVCRAIPGCAETLYGVVCRNGRVRSTLIASPPGMGKTTLLRDLVRLISDGGRQVSISDERHELAACVEGVPTLDVGLRTDVMDGGPKRVVIRQMLRALAPEVIVADEIGDPGDAEALAEAVRCGVSVICTAHAGSFGAMMERRTLKEVVASGVFSMGVLLNGAPGRIAEIRAFNGGEGWHAVDAGAVRDGGLRDLRQSRGLRDAPEGDGAQGADRGPEGAQDPHASHAGTRLQRADLHGLSAAGSDRPRHDAGDQRP